MKRIFIFTFFVGLLSASLLHATPPSGTQADNNWISDGNYYDISWYDASNIQPEYTFTTAAELAGLAYLISGQPNPAYWPLGSNSETPLRDKVFKLGADIDLSAHYWVPIGQGQNSFGGWFDGQGHTITGLYIDYSDDSYAYASTAANIYAGGYNASSGNMAGLFGRLNNQSAGAYIKNIVFGEGLIKTHPSCFAAGALVGYNNRNANLTISNIINMGVEIIGGAQAAGIVGYTQNGGSIYRNIANWAPVTMAYSDVIPNIMVYGGGLIGGAGDQVSLYNSYNAGTVTVTSSAARIFVGGLVGAIGLSVANLSNNPAGSLTATSGANYYLNNDNKYFDVGSQSTSDYYSSSDLFPDSRISTIEDMKTTGFIAKLNDGIVGETWISKGGLPVFEFVDMPTAMPEVKSNLFTCSENGVIVISGLQTGSPVKVYNLTGQVVWNGQAQQNLRIALSKGVYIVKSMVGQAKVINY